MQVGPNTMVTLNYTMQLDSGEVVDASEGQEPLVFEFGSSQIIPGLQRGLLGMQRGDTKKIRVTAAEAYGERRPEAVQEVPLDRFPEDVTLKVGLRLSLRGAQGEEIPFIVTGISDTHATLDFNHPLAGEGLTFVVTVVNVRASDGSSVILPGDA